ncbi:hypothetical protein [Candidatus Nitrosocaldus cavascurensis]|nr:hypothetical protein [Candidatus Nitrosocaldus cavascurensis]
MKSSETEIMLIVDEKELKRHISKISKEMPSLNGILRDIEKVVTLSCSIAYDLERRREMDEKEDSALCTRLKLARALAYNSATSAAAIISLLAEYIKDKSAKVDGY